jgi:hypothetical protein
LEIIEIQLKYILQSCFKKRCANLLQNITSHVLFH